jgi:hypothetical protein
MSSYRRLRLERIRHCGGSAISMPHGDHVLKRVPSGILIPVLARDADPCFARCAASIRPVLVRMNVETRNLAMVVLQRVRVYVDHQRDPVPFGRLFPRHVKRVPSYP